MNVVFTIVALLIGILSIAAGAAKIALIAEEVEFLSQFGFNDVLTISFGVFQVLGGVLLVVPAARMYGAVIAGTGFALSAVLLTMTASLMLAGLTLVPTVLAVLIAYRDYAGRRLRAPSKGDG